MSNASTTNDQVANAKPTENEEESGPSASNDDVTFDYPQVKYEFLDNTADVQIHSWGDSIEEAFEQVGWKLRTQQTLYSWELINQRYFQSVFEACRS